MARSPQRPSEAQVWARVREFASQRVEDGEPVPTLSEGVVNHITAVAGARIERTSAQGVTNATPIYRGEILRVWRDLAKNQYTRTARPNYFTLVLLQAALSDLIDDHGDGTIALRGWRSPPEGSAGGRPLSYEQRASEGHRAVQRSADQGELRESDEHWRIKHFIHAHPNQALASLPGGPFTASALELVLRVPTSDRVDVIVRDRVGRRVLIEVKARVGERDISLYAQAAKYRAIWRVLHHLAESREGGPRCALAAPSIPAPLARHMRTQHDIESAAVEVPADYAAPPR